MRHKATDIADRQHGVVTRAQLLRRRVVGIAGSRESGGQAGCIEVHAGVYAVGHRAMTDRGRWLAAVTGLH